MRWGLGGGKGRSEERRVRGEGWEAEGGGGEEGWEVRRVG